MAEPNVGVNELQGSISLLQVHQLCSVPQSGGVCASERPLQQQQLQQQQEEQQQQQQWQQQEQGAALTSRRRAQTCRW